MTMRQKRTLLFLSFIFMFVGTGLTLENFKLIAGFSVHWPAFLIISGAGLIMLFYHQNKIDDVLVWLGSFILLLGIFFYYLNLTAWNQLATLWPVFLGLVGISFLTIGLIKQNRLFTYFGITFIGLFLTFTLVFTVSKDLWPMSFVVFGACLLIIEYYNKIIN
jgi:hypothetical protein